MSSYRAKSVAPEAARDSVDGTRFQVKFREPENLHISKADERYSDISDLSSQKTRTSNPPTTKTRGKRVQVSSVEDDVPQTKLPRKSSIRSKTPVLEVASEDDLPDRKSSTRSKIPGSTKTSFFEIVPEENSTSKGVEIPISPSCPQVNKLFLYLKNQFLKAKPEDYSTVLFVTKCVSQGWYSVTSEMESRL